MAIVMQRISMISLIALLIWLSAFAGARTYIVDDSGFANYDTIQGAVDAASDGDTIYIKPGQYSEEIVLNKSLKIMPLTGETGPIILDGGDSLKTAITINSDGCSLQGLSAKNYAGPAVYVKSDRNSIQENIIEDSNPALLVRGGGENTISQNTIIDSQGAIAIWDDSNNNTVKGNQISSCNISILIREAAGNQVLDNIISLAYWGIWLDDADSCQAEGNNIESEDLGILIQNSSAIGIDRNLVRIMASVSANTVGITLENSTEIKLHKNEIKGGNIGLGVSLCREGLLSDNSIADSTSAIFIKDSSAARIINNSISDAQYAIRTENLSMGSIGQNRIERSTAGIVLLAAAMVNITDNQISAINDTAMQIASSHDNSFIGNRIADSQTGIIVVESSANRLSQNRLENVSTCLYVEASNKKGFENSIDESNVADTHPLVYLFNRTGGLIEGRDVAHLTLAYCNNLTVRNSSITTDALFLFNSRNNHIIKNEISSCYGMRLISSDGNEISGNSLQANEFSGMFLYDSNSNDIAGNNASHNRQNGISLLSCRQNTLRDNSLDGNFGSGIWLNLSDENLIYQNNISNNLMGLQVLDSSRNRIIHNNFRHNAQNALDSGGSNAWDQGNLTGGNYWDDHVAKGNPSQNWPMMIKGGGMLDRYPFQNENGWLLSDKAS